MSCHGLELISFTYESGGEGKTKEVRAETATKVNINDLISVQGSISHDCSRYLESRHDENYHWNECKICGKQYDKAPHNMQLIGNGPTCDVYTVLGNYVCSDCGYSKPVQPLSHIRSQVHWSDYLGYAHFSFYCERCGGGGSDGLGPGQRINESEETQNGPLKYYFDTKFYHHFSYKGGTYTVPELRDLVGADNIHSLGTLHCVDCGLDVDLSYHRMYDHNCYICGKNFYPDGQIYYDLPQNTIRNGNIVVPSSGGWVYWAAKLDGMQLQGASSRLHMGGPYAVDTYELVSDQNDIAVYRSYVKKTQNSISQNMLLYNRIAVYSPAAGTNVSTFDSMRYIVFDSTAPSVDDITQTPLASKNNWQTSVQIQVAGAETESDSVTLSLKTSTGGVLASASCPVSGERYSYTFIPALEGSVSGTSYTIEVTDIAGNTGSRSFTVYKTDAVAPVMTSDAQSGTGWSGKKTVTFTFADEGAGSCQMAINDPNAWVSCTKNGNTYTKSYVFDGDLYGSATMNIFVKDAADNSAMYKYTIWNLDNSVPRIGTIAVTDKIENGQAVGWNITVPADDVSIKTGTSGSGIMGYALTSSDMLQIPSSWQASAVFLVPVSGRYRLWVRDLTGNVSYKDTQIISDITYNGKPLSGSDYNGKKITYIMYNGKRLRL